MFLRSVLLLCCAALVISTGCEEKKAEPVKIDGLETYTDATTSFSLRYPKNWTIKKTPGERFVALSSAEVESRFVEFREGPSGAKIDVHVIHLKDQPLDQYINEDKIFDNSAYAPQENTTLGGAPAIKLSYSADAEDGKLKGIKLYSLKDTVLTTLEIAAFGSTYDAYKPQIDEILSTFVCAGPAKLPDTKPDTVQAAPEPPSSNFITAPGSGYSISIPDNFRAKGVKAAGAIGGSEYLGSRLDCTIRVDILDASKQTNLDKIAAENKAQFAGASQSPTTLGSVKAYMFSYSPAPGIGRYAYLCVKDGKLYRVFVTWNKTEEAVYLPIFKKCISTFQFK